MDAKNSRKVYFIDLDNTLFQTYGKAYIKERETGKLLKTLNTDDFNYYKNSPTHVVDFSEFTNTKFFIDTSKPIIPVLNKLIKIIEDIIINKKKDKIYILTARGDFDNKPAFLEFLNKCGIPQQAKSFIQIIRCGNLNERLFTASQKKQIIVLSVLANTKFTDFEMWDDCIDNLEKFYEAKLSATKETNFSFLHVVHDIVDGENMNYRCIRVSDAGCPNYIKKVKENRLVSGSSAVDQKITTKS